MLKESKSSYMVEPFHKGEVIFKEGQESRVAYLIKSGSVMIYKIINNKRIVLSEIGNGEIFGEMGVITEGPRSAYAQAIEYTELVVIDKKMLSEYLAHSPTVVHALTKLLIDRLIQQNERNYGESGSDIFMNVCSILDVMCKAHTDAIITVRKFASSGVMSISYDYISESIKNILIVSQIEIDSVLDQLRTLNLVKIVRAKKQDGTKVRYIKIPNPEHFLSMAKGFYEESKRDSKYEIEQLEFIDINDFANLIDTTPEIMRTKIGSGEIPSKLIFVHKDGARAWAVKKVKPYAKKVEEIKKEFRVEDMMSINQIIKIDDLTVKQTFSELGAQKLGILAAIANKKAREKIYQNVSQRIETILKDRLADGKAVDGAEAANIEQKFISIIKKLKGVSKVQPTDSSKNKLSNNRSGESGHLKLKELKL
ncbi:putative Cyclic nucleotide-binding domain-containing protein [Candidatus Magnetomoraceae bacterium gMMP-15]